MRTLIGTALCLAACTASAQLYRWTDDKGRVHVTDTPPPAAAKAVRKLPDGAPPAKPAAADPTETFEIRQLRARYPITLYTTPGCDVCNEARALLNARGLPFSEVSVRDPAQMEELQRISGGAQVPTMTVGSTAQRGFETGMYQAMLDAAGYPKTGALPPRKQAEPDAPKPTIPEIKPVEEPERPSGPYAPGAPPQKRTAKK